MDKREFKTPILFLIFNRPDTTQKVFDQIKRIKPKKLFIAADGPRDNVLDDYEKCMFSRRIIDQIDWECEVKTLFREKNLGCGMAISSAISWFFDNVEEGIILEDDCVPDMTFFYFCQILLEKYRFEKRVMMITGTSYFFNKVKKDYDYFFSKYYAIWGWATWKRVWKKYDFELNDWKQSKYQRMKELKQIFRKASIVEYWKGNFDAIVNKRIDAWGLQWCYTCIFNNGFSITPLYNLISNIGKVGVHTKSPGPFFRMPIKSLNLHSLCGPDVLKENRLLDKIIYKKVGVIKPFSFKNFSKNILRKVYFSLRG